MALIRRKENCWATCKQLSSTPNERLGKKGISDYMVIGKMELGEIGIV